MPLVLFFLLLFVSSAWAQAQLVVEWQGERLSVTAQKMPLSQILHEIAQRTGMKIRWGEGLRDETSVRLSHLPLLEGLQKLLADVNYLIIEETTPQGKRQPVCALVFAQRVGGRPQEIVSAVGVKSDGAGAARDEEQNPPV